MSIVGMSVLGGILIPEVLEGTLSSMNPAAFKSEKMFFFVLLVYCPTTLRPIQKFQSLRSNSFV
jgi:hypothetical protein